MNKWFNDSINNFIYSTWILAFNIIRFFTYRWTILNSPMKNRIPRNLQNLEVSQVRGLAVVEWVMPSPLVEDCPNS